ncbi:MAG: hypothetical protein Q7S00_02695, partial [bacterium]|nr:hypothetical protein [bacterium]
MKLVLNFRFLIFFGLVFLFFALLFQKIWIQGALLDCPTDPRYTYDLHGNAECFILINHQLLAERHTLSGKLNLPGGMRKVG